MEKQQIKEAYEDVRDDQTDTTWFTCKLEGNDIVMSSSGTCYNDLLNQFGDNDRVFAFVRVIMGDEMSKRPKFAFITWTGRNSSGMERARMGLQRSKVKSIVLSFATEIMADNLEEVSMAEVKDKLLKAGGANYGTGVRD